MVHAKVREPSEGLGVPSEAVEFGRVRNGLEGKYSPSTLGCLMEPEFGRRPRRREVSPRRERGGGPQG